MNIYLELIINVICKNKLVLFTLLLYIVTEIHSLDWQVNYVITSSMLQQVNDPSVQLNLKVKELGNEKPKLHTVDMSSTKFLLLLHGKYVYAFYVKIILNICLIFNLFAIKSIMIYFNISVGSNLLCLNSILY